MYKSEIPRLHLTQSSQKDRNGKKKIKENGKRQTKINKGQDTSVPYRDGISI